MEKHIEFLAGAVSEIIGQRNHLQTLHQIFYRLKGVMPVSAVALVLADPVTEELNVAAQHNISRAAAAALKGIVKPAVISRVFYRDPFIVVSTDDELSDFKNLQLDEEYHEAVLVRVSDRNRATGFLVLFFKEVIRIEPPQRHFLTVFAGLVSLALEKRERKEAPVISEKVCSETHLLTYPSFFKHLEAEMERAARLGLPLTLALLDIGNYRQILGTYGMETARRLVCEVARDIRATIRKNDVAGVYGADEFIVYVPEAAPDEAMGILKQCTERVAGGVYTEEKLSSSIVIGAAHFAKGEEPADLLLKMQKAFYQARSSEEGLHIWGA